MTQPPHEIITVCGDRWETRTADISLGKNMNRSFIPAERLYPKLLETLLGTPPPPNPTEDDDDDDDEWSVMKRRHSSRRAKMQGWKETYEEEEGMVVIKNPPAPPSGRLSSSLSLSLHDSSAMNRRRLSRHPSRERSVSPGPSKPESSSRPRPVELNISTLAQNASIEEASRSLFGGKKEWSAGEDERFHVEVVPGVEAELRGSYETRKAILSGSQLSKICCTDCTCELNVISEAEYVLCPLCRSVSPLEQDSSVSSRVSGRRGVGIGFVFHETT